MEQLPRGVPGSNKVTRLHESRLTPHLIDTWIHHHSTFKKVSYLDWQFVQAYLGMAHLEPSQSKDPDLVSAGQTKVKQYNTTEYLQSLLDFSTPDKTTTSAKTGYKLEHVENDSIPLPVHLTPFTPYVEKCPYTLSLDYGSSTLPRDWIRLSTIRNWILECDSNHSCKDDGKNSRQVLSPPCLIDVKRRCLTQDTKGISYVALSYVWGRKESACTTIDNLKLLLEPGSLEKEQTTPPQTILDVMELVESIGERYLWVDR